MKEDAEPPMVSSERKDILTNTTSSRFMFNDIHWSLVHGQLTPLTSSKAIASQILKSESILALIAGNPQEEAKAQQICKIMVADYSVRVLRIFAWALHKIFRNIFDKVKFDEIQYIKPMLEPSYPEVKGKNINVPVRPHFFKNRF